MENEDMIANYLCGWSCGTAADGIIEYCSRPDISKVQVNRIIEELSKIINYEKEV